MRRHRHFHVTRRQPNWLLVCAMLALSVHALANIGLMPARGFAAGGAASPFFAEICTGRGAPQGGPNALRIALSDAAEHAAQWCELCSLAGGPALTSAQATQAFAARPGARLAAAPPAAPARTEWVLQAPRGPPRLG
ncbi:DUF2946 family protein [Rhodoferax sp.]|uniref:DUF2946 family protein n=1 Tax=Rhodoferax sp. TaxID=50421 RepID=UPI0027578373|nr:hypothetical protein [Rhodoferax sp.]